MLIVCRITTIVAMLLHSMFGCSLHHGHSCNSHAASLCDVADHPSVQHENDCCHSHSTPDYSGRGQGSCISEVIASSEAIFATECPGRDSEPCDGGLPGCHSTGTCSFVPSSDVIFVCDAVLIGFISYDLDSSMARARTFGWQQQCQFSGIKDSLSRCASLCTWLI